MGRRNIPVPKRVTKSLSAPNINEFELTLFGPGYGESIVIHLGDGHWIIVDSHLTSENKPQATSYLQSIGVDLAKDVCLIVATHWHDDHIQGIADILKTCSSAEFCCSVFLTRKEFLAAVYALEERHLTFRGSGAREIYRVIRHLKDANRKFKFALANRRIYSQNGCDIWTLSPDDGLGLDFIQSIGDQFPELGGNKRRAKNQQPNRFCVVLWIEISGVVVLLGADLERNGWVKILNSSERPDDQASLFKVPHHGAQNADKLDVWQKMLNSNPIAILTPWKKGGRILPKEQDIERIVSHTKNAFATSLPEKSLYKARKSRSRNPAVEKTIRESGINIKKFATSDAFVRLRRPIGSPADWTVDLFGRACRLRNLSTN